MNTDMLQRQPHVVLDLPSRRHKGLKIERLLELHNRTQPIRILEVGTGSGDIAHYFGTHPNLRCDVTAVDVVDQQLVTDGYHFEQLLVSANLAFAYLGTRALHEMIAIEGGKGRLASFIETLPDTLLDWLAPLNPTLIYRMCRV